MWKLFVIVISITGEPHYKLYVMDASLDVRGFQKYSDCMQIAKESDHTNLVTQLQKVPELMGKTIAFGCLRNIQ